MSQSDGNKEDNQVRTGKSHRREEERRSREDQEKREREEREEREKIKQERR